MTTHPKRRHDDYQRNWPTIVAGVLILAWLIVCTSQAMAQTKEQYPLEFTDQYGRTFEVPWGKKPVLVPWWWSVEHIRLVKDGAHKVQLPPVVIDTVDCEREVVLSPNIPDPDC